MIARHRPHQDQRGHLAALRRPRPRGDRDQGCRRGDPRQRNTMTIIMMPSEFVELARGFSEIAKR
jgi:hypothetical protein